MKCKFWLESRFSALSDGRASKHGERSDLKDEVKKPVYCDPVLPIASAFSTASYINVSRSSADTGNNVRCESPLMSRPRPIAQNGTEKSFFSRGTISTENTNLPTRVHSKYRPSFFAPQERAASEKLPDRERLLDIITELYPRMIKYIDSGMNSHRKYHSSGSRSFGSMALQSEFGHKYSNSATSSYLLPTETYSAGSGHKKLRTSPVSPMSLVGQLSPPFKDLAKSPDSSEEREYQQLRDFLIRFLSCHGKELSAELRLRILECFSITPADLAPENGWLFRKHPVSYDGEQKEQCDLPLKTLIGALKSKISDYSREQVESWKPVDSPDLQTPMSTLKSVRSSDEKMNRDTDETDAEEQPKIRRGYRSDLNLAKHRLDSVLANRPTFFRGTKFETLNRNFSILTSRLTPLGFKGTRDNGNIIRRRLLGGKE